MKFQIFSWIECGVESISFHPLVKIQLETPFVKTLKAGNFIKDHLKTPFLYNGPASSMLPIVIIDLIYDA